MVAVGSPGSENPSTPAPPPATHASSGSWHGLITEQRCKHRGPLGAGTAVLFHAAHAALVGQPTLHGAVHRLRSPRDSHTPVAHAAGSGSPPVPRQLSPTPPGTPMKQPSANV